MLVQGWKRSGAKPVATQTQWMSGCAVKQFPAESPHWTHLSSPAGSSLETIYVNVDSKTKPFGITNLFPSLPLFSHLVCSSLMICVTFSILSTKFCNSNSSDALPWKDLSCRLQFCNTAVELTQAIWISVGISVLTLQFLIFQVQCVDSYHCSKQIEHLLNLFYRVRRKGSHFKLYMEPTYKNIRRFPEDVTWYKPGIQRHL